MFACVFPGQGSQALGMGGALFDTVPEFTAAESQIDALLGYSVREVCLQGPEARLKDTRYTQPCMFVVNALTYFDGLRTHGRPDAVAGHSLGEYNALLAAGAFDLLTGLRIVARRAELMAAANGGGMAAVLKVPAERVLALLRDHDLGMLDVANFNAPLQTVIAGPADAISRAIATFQREGVSCLPLPVSAPFHSRYMADAARQFGSFLESIPFGSLAMPVVSNVTAFPYPQYGPASIRSLLVRQIVQPVRWVDCVQRLSSLGVTSFKETGPGTVLTRLWQQIAPQPAS